MGKDTTNPIFEAIKDKVFFSRYSNVMVEVVEELPEDGETGKAYFDGMTLIDCVEEIEDDIQQVYAFTKPGKMVNLEDYYEEHGAFDKERWGEFVEALGRLMTREEYDYLTTYEEPFRPDKKLYNLQEVLLECGISREEWEDDSEDRPDIVIYYKISSGLMDELADKDGFYGVNEELGIEVFEDEDSLAGFLCIFSVEEEAMASSWDELTRFDHIESYEQYDEDDTINTTIDYGPGDKYLRELLDRLEKEG